MDTPKRCDRQSHSPLENDGSGPKDAQEPSFREDRFAQLLRMRRQNPAYEIDEFGLVFVAGWPTMGGMVATKYHSLLEHIKECFEPIDLDKATYFYPSRCLHVTICTLHACSHQTRDPTERRNLLIHWRGVLESASKKPGWPKSPLQIQLKGIQVSDRAGILLWEETTGGMDTMRSMVGEEVELSRRGLEAMGINVNTLHIPNIVHTSFLRFPSVPVSRIETVRRRLKEDVVPKFMDLLSAPFSLVDAKLVCEKIPYVHIPHDEEHVLAEFRLG